MSKIDIDKFVAYLYEQELNVLPVGVMTVSLDILKAALEDQGLEYRGGEIVNIDPINPSEFYKRLNALLKEFESLPKEELADSLEFYLKAVRHDTPFALMRLKEVAKPEIIKPTGVLGELLKTPPTQEELKEAEKELNHPQSDQELTEFEKAFDRLAFNYIQDPDYTNEGTVRDCKKYARELLSIAKKQLLEEPRFLYTVTRKAAERERKETIDEACRWLRRTQPEETMPDTTIDRFKKHMEEQQ